MTRLRPLGHFAARTSHHPPICPSGLLAQRWCPLIAQSETVGLSVYLLNLPLLKVIKRYKKSKLFPRLPGGCLVLFWGGRTPLTFLFSTERLNVQTDNAIPYMTVEL